MAAAVLLLAACFSFGSLPGGAAQPDVSQANPTATRTASTRTSTPQPSPTPTPPAELQVDLASLRGVTVTLWQPFVGEMGDLFTQMVAEFSRQNEWGIQAQVVALGSDRGLAQQIDLAEGEVLPQVVLAPSAQLNAWLAAGRLAPLDLYLTYPPVQMDPAVRDGFAALFWQQDSLDGQQAGIPALRTAYGLLYNQTWAGELGFTSPPVTLAQFREQACAAAVFNNRSQYLEQRGTGGWLVDTSAEVTLNWLLAFGAQPIPAREGEDYHFDQQAALSAFSFLRKLQEDGCAWLGKNPTPQQYFAERSALFVSGSLQDLLPQARLLEGQENADDWLLLGYPAEQDGPFVSTEGYSYGLLGGDPAQQMAGWLLIRWLSQPENQARLGVLYPSLPVSSAWQAQTAADWAAFPWNWILALEKSRILPAPTLPGWLVARRPLQDAGWQLYNLASDDQLPDILPQLDALIKELLIQ